MRSARLAAFALLFALPGLARADSPFYLKDGDRVVFYGDSITDQRLYTTFAETYAVTRFPKANVTFVHSGWGGDRVTGGGGGPIDVRLDRDVIAYKPTVVTIMLGMNDASYQPFRDPIFNTYADGYRHIVEKLKADVPGVRLTLIKPSPYDDVTRKPKFEGGYNAVLIRYGDFVRELAAEVGRRLRRPQHLGRRGHQEGVRQRPRGRREAQPGPGPPRPRRPAPDGRRPAEGLERPVDRLVRRHRRPGRQGPPTTTSTENAAVTDLAADGRRRSAGPSSTRPCRSRST